MIRGRGHVEFEDTRVGTGEAAGRDHKGRVAYTLTLHKGEVIRSVASTWVDLKRRETIAGLRYGIEGMRVGGARRIVVPPQLAYGEDGAPGVVPPNAMLIFEVELLELKPTHPIKPKLQQARERKSQQGQ